MSRVLRNYDYLQPDMGRVQSGESGQLRNEKLMNFVNYLVEIMFTIPPRVWRMGWWWWRCVLPDSDFTHTS